MIYSRPAVFAVVLGFATATFTNAQSVTFDFDSGNVTFRQPTPFDYTKGGLTAHFSSPTPYDPASFSIQNLYKLTLLAGNFLSDNRIEFRNPLDIGFNQPLSAISLAFATIDSHIESPIRLTAYFDSTVVGSLRMQGATRPNEPYPQGTLSFASANKPFNKVRIEIPVEIPAIGYDPRYLATDFLVDNIAATVALPGVISTVSAAAYGTALAPESIASGFGQMLAANTEGAISQPLPTTLANTVVTVKDSSDIEQRAPLFFVSPSQINYLVPSGIALGKATVTVMNGGKVSAIGSISLDAVAPSFFTANFDGKGAPAGAAISIAPDLTQTVQPVAACGSAVGSCAPSAIDLGPTDTAVFLILYGTGIRGRSGLNAVKATIGKLDAEVRYAGVQPEFTGLDQVNILLPRALAGSGEVDLVVTVDGKPANPMRIRIK